MKQQINGNNPIRVLHMAPIRMGGITELVLTLSEKIDFEKVQFDYLTFEDTFDQAAKRAMRAWLGEISVVQVCLYQYFSLTLRGR